MVGSAKIKKPQIYLQSSCRVDRCQIKSVGIYDALPEASASVCLECLGNLLSCERQEKKPLVFVVMEQSMKTELCNTLAAQKVNKKCDVSKLSFLTLMT